LQNPSSSVFAFDLIAGSAVPEVTCSDLRTGVAHHVDLPQFLFSYIAPVGRGLRFELGKFATHMGYEVIGGYDEYNDHLSRSFSFGYGIPFTHTCGRPIASAPGSPDWFPSATVGTTFRD
jgi:hypothetical protein